VLALLAGYHVAAYSAAEFGMPLHSSVGLPLWSGSSVWLWSERLSFGGFEGRGETAAEELTQAMLRTGVETPAVAIVPTTPWLNANAVTWQFTKHDAEVRAFALGDPTYSTAVDERFLAGLDFAILKSGPQGLAWATGQSESISRTIASDERFALTASVPMPDGSSAFLYRARADMKPREEPPSSAAPPILETITFGERLVLTGLFLEAEGSGARVRLEWRSLRTQKLGKLVAVHVVDAAGKILAQADYPQAVKEASVEPGSTWRDVVLLPGEKLRGGVALGFTVYGTDGAPPLLVDRGPRDWDGHRLLVQLPANVIGNAGSR